MKYCQHCNTQYPDSIQFCPQCGAPLQHVEATPPPYGYGNGGGTPYYANGNDAFSPSGPEGKCRGVAALLAIIVGTLGVHYFYLGKVAGGLLTILLCAVTCGLWSVVVFIQGILMLCMTNEEFERKYVTNPSSFPLF